MIDTMLIKLTGVLESKLKGVSIGQVTGIEHAVGVVPGTAGSSMHNVTILDPGNGGTDTHGNGRGTKRVVQYGYGVLVRTRVCSRRRGLTGGFATEKGKGN